MTEGVGHVQSRGPLLAIRPGDVVRIAGGEEHWHGATPDSFMTHVAITEGQTEWGDHLTDGDYRQQGRALEVAPECPSHDDAV